MTIDEEEVDVEGVDKMWKYEPGTCDSTVSRVKDDNDVEWIEVKKTLVYGDSPDAAQKVQDTVVYLQVKFFTTLLSMRKSADSDPSKPMP